MLMPGTKNISQQENRWLGDAPPRAEEIRTANRATYWPVAPIDLVVVAPLVAQLILRASPAGQIVQAAAIGAYLGSALRDWRDRKGSGGSTFVGSSARMSMASCRCRARSAPPRSHTLAARLNDEFTDRRLPRQEVAVEVDRRLTEYVAGMTGQLVQTSVEIRGFTLARLAFPFALGACDILSGDVAIFADTGFFEPHIIAHEFCHRKGYWKELHAQALAYLALAGSGHPALRQAALLERVYRDLRVLYWGRRRGIRSARRARQASVPSSARASSQLPTALRLSAAWKPAMRRLYDARMRLTGQNGISDYDLGFTNFLYTFETSNTARQRRAEARG